MSARRLPGLQLVAVHHQLDGPYGHAQHLRRLDGVEVELTPEEYAEFEAKEQLLLTITINGFGKRTSAYEYRVTNRGGQGIINIETSARNGRVAATFPVAETDQVMLVTDQGQTIRIPVHDIRIAGRNTQGVKLFHTGPDEHIVSTARLREGEGDGDGEETGEE